MKQKIQYTLFVLFINSISICAQYYGNKVFSEGFDTEDALASWTQENSEAANPSKWATGNAFYPFSKIDPTSSGSACFVFEGDTRPVVTLTSPEIDLSGKSDMLIGFYGYELNFCFRYGGVFKFRISKDNGLTWKDLFDSEGDSFYSTGIEKWYLYKYDLPEEFNGEKVKLQFYADATAVDYLPGFEGYIDGVFISERYKADPEAVSLNYSDGMSGLFTEEEPVRLDFLNMGSDPIRLIELYFQVDDGPEVVETVNPEKPVLSGESVKYTFTRKADLSASGSTIRLKAGVRMENDGNNTNNEISVSITNLAVGIPYVPRFSYLDGGTLVISSDEWQSIRKSGDAAWELFDSGWYIDHSNSTSTADAYLVSRPVRLAKGKTYDVWLDAYTGGDILSEEQKNRMKVYVTTDENVTADMNLIWENKSVDQTNSTSTSVRYTAPESNFYYFTFVCQSPSTANRLTIDHLFICESFDKDAGVMAITSPENGSYLYGKEEQVEIAVHNYGLERILADQAEVHLQLNNGNIITETLKQDIEPNRYIKHRFATPVDLSDVNILRNLSAWTSLKGDSDVSNDTTRMSMTSTVAGIPYLPDFGTARVMSPEPDFWSVADKNADGYGFNPASDSELSTYVFAYGGSKGITTVKVPTSDDELYSRPIRLDAKTQYRLSYSTKIDRENALLPLAVNLYKVDGENKTFIKEIYGGNIASTSYQEMNHLIDSEEAGVYVLGFAVDYPEPITFKIRLGRFRLTKVYDVNLTLEELLFPATDISCFKSLPVGAVVKNSGKSTITSFTLNGYFSGLNAATKEVSGISLKSGERRIVYFDEDLVFPGEENGIFNLSVSTGGDEWSADNQLSIQYGSVTPEVLPANLQLGYSQPKGWAMINENQDEYLFSFKAGKGFVYEAGKNGTAADDRLISNCYSMEKDKLYALEFNFSVLAEDTASFDVCLMKEGTRIDFARIDKVTGGNGAKKSFKGYFSVPETEEYVVCFHAFDDTRYFSLNGSFRIYETDTRPDIELTEITLPVQDAVFSEKETIAVTFKNNGKQALSCIPFTCKVNNKVYDSVNMDYVSAGDDLYTVEFSDVDLFAPGSYQVEVTARVSQDMTPENNCMRKTVTSLPVLDVALVSLDSPGSGALGKEEVKVTVKNEGKGSISALPVKCIVTSGNAAYKKELSGVITDPVPVGETVQFCFPDKVDLFEEGQYNFALSVELDGDINVANNVKQVSVMSSDKELDTGVVGIAGPENGLLGKEETVSVKVKNYSVVDLFEIPVTAVIEHTENTDVASRTITGKVPVIKAGEAIDYAFEQTVDMQRVGLYKVKAYTCFPNDTHPENDAVEKMIKSYLTDVGVVEVLSPESGTDLGLCEVTIRVKNFGEATVDRVPVMYKVGSMPQLGKIEEPIAPGESVVYTFPVLYDFVSYKKYTIIAGTELETDADNSNDVCEVEVENKPAGIVSLIQDEVVIYPNPSHGEFVVSTGTALLKSICIGNMEGALISRYDGLDVNLQRFITDLSQGVYLIRIVTSSGVFNSKLVINK